MALSPHGDRRLPVALSLRTQLWDPDPRILTDTPELELRLRSLFDAPYLQIVDDPSQEIEVALRATPDKPRVPTSAAYAYALAPLSAAEFEHLEAQVAELAVTRRDLSPSLSPNLRIASAEAWCPGEATFPLFGTRDLALAQMRAGAAAAKGATGTNVVVVIVDQGINEAVLRARVPGAKFGGGWRVREGGKGGPSPAGPWREPGDWPDGHGTRMAELVLSVAPHAIILDLPLLPTRILQLRGFLHHAWWTYESLAWSIPWITDILDVGMPWVLCNPWSVYDLRQDFPGTSPWRYGDNPHNPFSRTVAALPAHGLADAVFVAGNCGQFCPDVRCARPQIGPGRSIYGVNAMPEVLSVGAVRGDEIWLGYSSQGPAPPGFDARKPDLVAPSQFAGPRDWGRGYTGTSSACALAAGAFAAARSVAPTSGLAPAALIQRAVATARPPAGGVPDPDRLGSGMLDLDRFI